MTPRETFVLAALGLLLAGLVLYGLWRSFGPRGRHRRHDAGSALDWLGDGDGGD